MKRLLTLLSALASCVVLSTAHANSETFVRDYTYIASDLDSKVTARKNALKLIKAGVLEEIVSYTSNTSLLQQSQLGETFEKSFIQSATTMSAGFMRVKVLEERWDGFQMYVKAEVRANPARVRQQLEDAIAAAEHINKTYQPNTQQPAEMPHQSTANSATMNHLNASSAAQAVASTLNQSTADYSGYVKAAKLSQVMSLLMPVRMRMNEYRSIHGEWPDEMKDIKLKAGEMNDGEFIEAVKLGKDGKIFAFLDSKFGSDKLLSYAPREIMGGMNMRWECLSNISMKTMMQSQCKEDPKLHFDGKNRQ